ncbi:NAD-P-binding protein [Rickenella mellea]|uniref:NAD-P-binding protein n=1 Tax=Rickenella mellea TaxID=50990 RepID=A0A4Y7PZG6_9AGAM|nr:NAD-P-binding protein [Rickenella mellea]
MGVIWDFMVSMMVESFPPKPKWTAENIPELGGKVIIMTGGNSGLGLEATKVLLNHGAKVYMATRNKEKAQDAIKEIARDTGKEPIFLQLDLADLDSVKRAADEFLSKETRLHVLYNSGGVMIPPVENITSQGYDLQFGTNVLGHFYLTKLLLPTLVETAKVSADGVARVVNVSSGAHHLHKLSYDSLKDGPVRKNMSAEMLYAQSKFGVVVFARELARRYGDQGIVSIAMNPGNINTNLQRRVTGFQKSMINWMLYPIVPNGIVTHLWAGTAEETEAYNGKYLIPWARVGKPRADTQDPKTGEELWKWLDAQVVGR